MKKISTWLIIMGILIAAIPTIGRLYVNYQQDKLYTDYLAQLESLPSTDIMDEGFSDEITTDEAIKAQAVKPTALKNVIGSIEIPAISSKQLLLEGSSNKEMRFGAGHVIGTALPGTVGNCAISAHRDYTFGTYFSRLGEVKIGNLVNVTYKGNEFTYSVTDISVVLPSDVSVLKSTKIPTITLITCHPKGSSSHRLIVKGVLMVNGKPAAEPVPEVVVTVPGIDWATETDTVTVPGIPH